MTSSASCARPAQEQNRSWRTDLTPRIRPPPARPAPWTYRRPWRPLHWLEPGPFAIPGRGFGFALAAKLLQPNAVVWLLRTGVSTGVTADQHRTLTTVGGSAVAIVNFLPVPPSQSPAAAAAAAADESTDDLGLVSVTATSLDDLKATLRDAGRQCQAGQTVVLNCGFSVLPPPYDATEAAA